MAADISKLADENRCGEAIALYETYKKENVTQVGDVARLATKSRDYGGKKAFSRCLLEAGRYQEIISQFEAACVSFNPATISVIEQVLVCDKTSSDEVGAAYQAAGRENPLTKTDFVAQIKSASEYGSRVESATSGIFTRLVTASGEVGTPSGALRYHRQMRDAAAQSIRLIDEEIQRYRAENKPMLVRVLQEKRQRSSELLAEHQASITELTGSREAAQQIRDATPAILNALTGATSASVPAGASAASSARFPADLVYFNAPGLEPNQYYRPLGCAVYVPRSAERYDIQNNCRYTVDVFTQSGPYRLDTVYGGQPRASLKPGRTANQSFGPQARSTLLSCLEVDSILVRRKGDLAGFPEFEGHVCKRHSSTNGGGVTSTR